LIPIVSVLREIVLTLSSAFDECVAGRHACERTCVDGSAPDPGYTCSDASGSRFPVGEAAMQYFSLAQAIFPSVNITPRGFRNIVVSPPPSNDATYTIGLNRNMNGIDLLFSCHNFEF